MFIIVIPVSYDENAEAFILIWQKILQWMFFHICIAYPNCNVWLNMPYTSINLYVNNNANKYPPTE